MIDNTPETEASALPPARRRRTLATLCTAVGVSSVGDGMVMVAFPLLALAWTGNVLLVSLVAVAGRLPGFLLALPAGVVVDRTDRRRLVTVVNAARTAILILFAIAASLDVGRFAALYVTVGVLGAGEVFVDIAVQASVPDLVPRSELPAATGYLAGADQAGEQMVGPALGGIATAAGAWLPVVGDAASFMVGTILARRLVPAGRRPPSGTSVRADLAEGLRWFASHRPLRTLSLVVGTLAACQSAVVAVIIVFARRDLHLSATGSGLFLAVAATGQVIGYLSAGRAYRRFGPAPTLVSAAVVAGAAYLVLAATTSVLVAGAALIVEAVAVGCGDAAAGGVRQLVTPAEMLGRSGAAYRMVILATLPLGSLAGGLIASGAGVAVALAVAGGAQLVAAALAGPRLLRVLPVISLEDAPADGTPAPTAGPGSDPIEAADPAGAGDRAGTSQG